MSRQPECPECGDGIDLDPHDGRGPRLHPGDWVECCDREYLLTDDGEGDIGLWLELQFLDDSGDGWRVSTIRLVPQARGMRFETMGLGDLMNEGDCVRTKAEKGARVAHRLMVRLAEERARRRVRIHDHGNKSWCDIKHDGWQVTVDIVSEALSGGASLRIDPAFSWPTQVAEWVSAAVDIKSNDEHLLRTWAAIRMPAANSLAACPTVDEVRAAIAEGRAALANHVSDAEPVSEGASS